MTVGMFGQGSRFFSVALLLYSPLGVSFALRVICSHGLVGLGTHGPNTVIKKKTLGWDCATCLGRIHIHARAKVEIVTSRIVCPLLSGEWGRIES